MTEYVAILLKMDFGYDSTFTTNQEATFFFFITYAISSLMLQNDVWTIL